VQIALDSEGAVSREGSGACDSVQGTAVPGSKNSTFIIKRTKHGPAKIVLPAGQHTETMGKFTNTAYKHRRGMRGIIVSGPADGGTVRHGRGPQSPGNPAKSPTRVLSPVS
jgi:hypothetical protein